MLLLTFFLAATSFGTNALNQACLESRIACFDTWVNTNQDCNATYSYNDCNRRVKQRGVCPQNVATVEEIYDASVDCGLTPRRKRHVFPELNDNLHIKLPRFVDSDGTKLYEFVYNRRVNWKEASEFCAKAGGSLFIPRHHHNIISLDVFLRRNIKETINSQLVYTGPSENRDGLYLVGSKTNDADKFWVGATDSLKEDEFRFEDGSTLSWDFFAHYQGIHDSGFLGILRRRGEDCVTMQMSTLQGFVRNCNQKRLFVCQYWGTPKH